MPSCPCFCHKRLANQLAAKKLKTMESSSEEFSRFMDLPDHIKTDVLSFCDFETMMNATKTCSELNKFVFSEAKLAKRVKMSSKKGSVHRLMKCLLKTERKPRNLEINQIRFVDKQSWLEVFKAKGSFIEELKVGTEDFDTGELLVHCVNLKKLSIAETWETQTDSNVARRLHMPKLKVLEMNLFGIGFKAIFSNIRSLEVFIVKECGSSIEQETARKAEDFIIQQDNLKTLVLHLNTEHRLFPKSRLGEVKFQLEYLYLDTHLESANEFYQTQSTSLKGLEFWDLEDFNVSVLTKLETLKVNGNWEAVFENGVENRSVKTLEGRLNISPDHLEHIFNVFPNVMRVEVKGPLHGISALRQFKMSSDRLKMLTIKDEPCSAGTTIYRNYFDYQPQELSTDLAKDAGNILDFIRNHRSIKIITIVIKHPRNPVTDWPTSFEHDVRLLILGIYNIEVQLIPN